MKLTQENLDQFVEFVRENAVIQHNPKSGKDYITVPGFNAEIGDMAGQIRVSFYGISNIADAAQRREKRVKSDIAKLTPEQRLALLEELA